MSKKGGSDFLGDRMRAVTGGTKPEGRRVSIGQTPAPAKAVRNKRAAERRSAFKEGLFFAPTGEHVKIVLKNISDTGAQIGFFTGGTAISGHGTLSVPTLGLQGKVRVVWKDQNTAGLQFLD